jgi:hypothetical protein
MQCRTRRSWPHRCLCPCIHSGRESVQLGKTSGRHLAPSYRRLRRSSHRPLRRSQRHRRSRRRRFRRHHRPNGRRHRCLGSRQDFVLRHRRTRFPRCSHHRRRSPAVSQQTHPRAERGRSQRDPKKQECATSSTLRRIDSCDPPLSPRSNEDQRTLGRRRSSRRSRSFVSNSSLYEQRSTLVTRETSLSACRRGANGAWRLRDCRVCCFLPHREMASTSLEW